MFERIKRKLFLKRLKTSAKKREIAKQKRKHRKKILLNLGNAVLYTSDVFVLLMVIVWMFYIITTLPAAWLELLRFGSSSIFTDIKDACILPLSVGGAIWLIRICITHHSANKQGKRLTPDFPNLDADGNVIPLELDSEKDAIIENQVKDEEDEKIDITLDDEEPPDES